MEETKELEEIMRKMVSSDKPHMDELDLMLLLVKKEKEIEQLRKEKEWLLEHYATRRYSHRPDKTKKTIAKEIAEQMQQALKELS